MRKLSILITLLLAVSTALAQTIPGTWKLYPPQTSIYQVGIRPPVNPDGTSVWAWKATVPVQYDLLQGYGPFTFASYKAPDATHQAYSYLYFGFATPVPFEQITQLQTDYLFTTGDCYGGSLRWTYYFQDNSAVVHAYYGTIPADFTPCTGTDSQSGMNLLSAALKTEPRFEIQGNGAPVYIPYADVLAEKSGKLVTGVNLILDSGWKDTQVMANGYPLNPTVGISDGSQAIWHPQSGTLSPVCPSDTATIQITKADGAGGFTITEEPVSTVPDQGANFRIVDCKYMYNVSGKSLGPGLYKVDVLLGGNPALQTAPQGTQFGLK